MRILNKWLILLLTVLPLLYLPMMAWQLWQMGDLILQGNFRVADFYLLLIFNMLVCVVILLVQAWYVYDATQRIYPNGDRERGKWLLALCIVPLLPNVLYWRKFIDKK